MTKKRKLKSGFCCLSDCISKTQALSQKVEAMLGITIVWLAWDSDLLVNWKPVMYLTKYQKKIKPRISSLVFNDFIKPRIFQELIECTVSMTKKRKIKSGVYCLYDCIYKTQFLFQEAEVMLGGNIVRFAFPSDHLVNLNL